MIEGLITKIEEDARWQVALLVLILALALGLRLYRLGDWSFWGDEAITLERASGIFSLSLSRWSPSLLLTNLAFGVFGMSEWSARIVPALGGVITVAVVYALVNEIFDPMVAAVASGLLAISPWHIYWSQNARFYTFLLLFFTLGLLYFYIGLEKDRLSYILLSLGFFGLAVIERMVGLFFVPVVGGYLVLLYLLRFEKPPGLRLRNILAFGVPLLAGSLLAVRSLSLFSDPSSWQTSFGWINANPFWIAAGVVYYVGLPGIVLGSLGGAYLMLSKDRAGLLFTIAALVPLLSIMLVSLVQYSANRYVFVSLTAWLILAAIAAVELLRAVRGAPHHYLALGAMAILILQPMSEDVLYYRYQHGNRDNWRAAFAFIETNMRDGDRVISGNPAVGRYYLDGEVSGMAYLEEADLEGVNSRTWFVEDMTVAKKWPHVHRWLRGHATLVRQFDVQVRARTFEMNVYLYQPTSLSADAISD